MRIKITAQRELTGQETQQIYRDLQMALSRFAGLVGAVNVVVEQPVRMNVHVQLRLRTGESIVVSERNPDVTSAARQAAQRAASVLDRNRSSLRAPRTARIRVASRFGD